MKAYGITGYKQPLTALTVDEPTPGPHDVLVHVTAAGVNHLDERVREGSLKIMLKYQMPLVLGHDVAGTVEAVGADVTGFAIGDRVYSRPRDLRIGTFAEKIAIHQDDLALAPKNVTDIEAGSLPLVALTAWQALVERANVQPGQKVLIHAGSGGVGTIAIQLAKHLGAHVATTATPKNADLVRDLGADVVIDYRTQKFEDELSGYDMVLDSLGPDNVNKSLTVLRPGGVVVGIAGPMTPAFADKANLGPVLKGVFAGMSLKTTRAAKKLGVRYESLFMAASGSQLRELAGLVETGVIRPAVGASFPFEQAPQALDASNKPIKPGKTVIEGLQD